jgi:hypothetical protein
MEESRKEKQEIYPLRGSKEDWSVENSEKLLEKKKEYAQEIVRQKIAGEPDFGSVFGADVLGTGDRTESLSVVKFTPDKEYRPSFSLLQQIQEDTVKGTAKEKLLSIQMDSQTQLLAQEQVLVRLKEMSILDWKSWFSDESDIYVITLVVDDNSQSPFKLELKSFPHVRKGEKLTIGSFGVQMYQHSGRVPSYLDMRILVARSKQKLRDAGEALGDIRNNNDFKSAVQTLSSLVTGPIGIVASQVDTIVGIIGAILKIQNDDQLLYYPVTVSKNFDNLGIGLNCDETRFVKLCYQIQAGGSALEQIQ